jgi:preprotein translocase SecF subunit
VDAKGSPVQKYPDIEILSVIPPEEGKGLGQGIGNIFKQFGRSGSREHQIRTGRQYAGLLEEPIESVLPDKSADPFHKGVKLTFIPARVVSNAAEVQAIVEKALPADSLAPVKPKVELLPQQGNVPAPVAVSLPPRQAEHRGNVVAALRKGIGVVASLRDDVMELYAGRLTPEPFGVDRPATDNPRDPLYGGKTITVNLQSPAPASALAGVLKDFFGQVVKPEETYRVEPSGATGDAPASAHNVSLSATAWARVEEVKRAFREAGTRTSPPFVLSKGPFQKEESIGSAVAHDLKSSAIMATILSWVGMILYLALRFRTWLHGIAAVVALVHDVLVALGFIALCGVLVPKAFGLQFEFSLQTVAAALTIIGFSVNDTIVIFDRIRENSQLMRRESLRNIIDLSVNQTMSRTILTSLTVFMVVTLLYAVTMRSAGGIADFAFPMIIGVISGTYSTIFIASPFLLLGRPAEFSAKPPAPVP